MFLVLSLEHKENLCEIRLCNKVKYNSNFFAPAHSQICVTSYWFMSHTWLLNYMVERQMNFRKIVNIIDEKLQVSMLRNALNKSNCQFYNSAPKSRAVQPCAQRTMTAHDICICLFCL